MHSATSVSHVGHGPSSHMDVSHGHGPPGGGGGGGGGDKRGAGGLGHIFASSGSGLAGSSSSIPNVNKRMHKGGMSGFGGGDK